MTDKTRELLERSADLLEWQECFSLAEEIRDFLSTPEPTQEPIGYVITIDPDKSYRKDSWVPWKEVEGMNGGKIRDDIPDGSLVYLRPAPRPEFVRLTDEEIASWFGAAIEGSLIEFARAIEDALKEKNRG